MLKPSLIVLQPTPYCNINCSYCYLRNRGDRRRMGADVLAAVRDKIFRWLEADACPRVVWHAGEPTTVPISWYEHAYAKLLPWSTAQTVFIMQTNGIAVDNRWVDFFKRTGTQVGLSIDGPQRFHDARRRTWSNQPTWALAVEALRRLQAAGFDPPVISVLHPDGLVVPDEYYRFYRDHGISHVRFSIDEIEGANTRSCLAAVDKDMIATFLYELLRIAYADGYMLHVREVERVAGALAGVVASDNEQVTAWQVIVVAADGSVSTFSPEFMEICSAAHDDFCFGNILRDDLDGLATNSAFLKTRAEVARGVEACRVGCRYFALCGGGAPANKMMENGTLDSTETLFCRLSIQAPADALLKLVDQPSRLS